ncbi:translation initiation factor IF-2-like [Acinonyx jubatus]|uniref:Translation initiation factor IF-2-like n=1 Tax=Acinonyx jubatus TaxID=32536 RepID=A0ABM3Q5X9_ACIJB|nr:translation initiation factor IF-2-like [Acinonyx jubatus]
MPNLRTRPASIDSLRDTAPAGRTRLALGAGIWVPPQVSERPRSLEGAGARGRSGFPRILDRARSAAEQGARRPAGAGLAAAEGGREGPGVERVSKEYICHRSYTVLLGPGFASGGWEDAGPSVTSPSAVRRAAKRPEGGGERHTKNAVSGGGERGRQIRDGNSRPRPPVPPPPGLGPRPRRQCGRAPTPRASECGRLRSPGPYLTVPRLAQPPPGQLGPRPGKGRPLAPAAGKEVGPRPPSPATCEPGKVCGASAGRRGAARPAPGVHGHRR